MIALRNFYILLDAINVLESLEFLEKSVISLYQIISCWETQPHMFESVLRWSRSFTKWKLTLRIYIGKESLESWNNRIRTAITLLSEHTYIRTIDLWLYPTILFFWISVLFMFEANWIWYQASSNHSMPFRHIIENCNQTEPWICRVRMPVMGIVSFMVYNIGLNSYSNGKSQI